MALSARAEGAYGIRAWGPLGIGLAAALAFFGAYGLRVSRAAIAAAGSLVALGAWSVVSTVWGGLPQQAWSSLDQLILAASALLVGGALVAAGRREAVLVGVLAGVAAQSAEILVRVGAGSAPAAWFYGRTLEGPVGYHNAQALLCALGLPLALWAASARRPLARAAGGACAGVLLAVLLLTQSRGAAVAVVAAVVVQLALSRSLRTLAVTVALSGAGVWTVLELRAVDASLLRNGPSGSVPALRAYVLVAVLVSLLVAAIAAAPAIRLGVRWRRRLLAAATAGALATAGATGLAFGPRVADDVRAAAVAAASDARPAAAAGSTRYAAISLDGRRDAWRVATAAIGESPLTGDGAGRFAVRWGVERSLTGLYILQPHSVELELGAELGVPGIVLFASFLLAAGIGLRRRLKSARALTGAAAACLVALLVEASADWTWSFPGLVAPTLLVVGAAIAPVGAGATVRRPLVFAAVCAALLAIAVPTIAAEEYHRAAAAATPAVALGHLHAAERLDPWNAEVVSAEGRLLEATGRYAAAAARYGRAAELSQRPWLERFRQARAFQAAGETTARVAACMAAQAADPNEDLLHAGPCPWPWLALHVPGARPPGPEGATRRSVPGT